MTTDIDGDGCKDDIEDSDDDNDSILDQYDAFPLDSSESIDTDSDGIGNNPVSYTHLTLPTIYSV